MSKKRKKTPVEMFTRSEVGVLLEHVDSKFEIVSEGDAVLNKRVDDLRQDMDSKFEEVNFKFGAVFQRFGQVDQRLDNIEDELRLIRNELKEKVGRDEFLVLEKRVAALEKTSRRQ